MYREGEVEYAIEYAEHVDKKDVYDDGDERVEASL